MNYGYMVIYQKNNGDLIYRARKTQPYYHKGNITSMGWKVVDIQRLYNGKNYSICEFDEKLNRKNKFRNITTLLRSINKSRVFEMILFIVILQIAVKF